MIKIIKEDLTICPNCSSDQIELSIKSFDYETNSGDYGIYLCNNCNIKFTNPRPYKDEIYKMYENRNTTDFPKSNIIIDFLRSIMNKFEIYSIFRQLGTRNKLKVLDFGCGDGAFSLSISKMNRVELVKSIDFHDCSPPNIVNKKKIQYINYNDYHFDDKFDIVVCRHVLEHQIDPNKFLESIKELLNKEGLLYIVVPNVDTYWLKIFKGFLFSLYVPRHFFHFERNSLNKLLSKSFNNITIHKSNTPVIGNSLKYYGKAGFSNLNLGGLFLYPIQLFFDFIHNKSTVLKAYAKKNN